MEFDNVEKQGLRSANSKSALECELYVFCVVEMIGDSNMKPVQESQPDRHAKSRPCKISVLFSRGRKSNQISDEITSA